MSEKDYSHLRGEVISARFKGQCCLCQRPIAAGEKIVWDSAQKMTDHLACAEREAAAQGVKTATKRDYYENARSVKVGEVIRHPYQDKQALLIVPTRQKSRYIREDGLSFGLDTDSGYLFTVEYRLATEEETRAFLLAEEEVKQKKARRAELFLVQGRVASTIRTRGQRPEQAAPKGRQWPEKKRYDNDYFLVDEEAGQIWLVVYNGRDGDGWDANNWMSSIAWVCPLDLVRDDLRTLGILGGAS